MIVGIDHIALSATDIDRATGIVSRWGYKPIFINKKLANEPAKRPYLRTKNLFHDISYCQPALKGIPIELTVHDNRYTGAEEDGCYEVIFSGINPGRDYDQVPERNSHNCDIIAEAFCSFTRSVSLKEFNAAAYHINEKGYEENRCVSINAILSESPNLDESADFWFNFGFSLKKADSAGGENWRLLEFKNHLLPRGFYLLVIRTDRIRKKIYGIDGAGFNCLAFLTSNISADRKRIKANGVEITDDFPFCAGNNPLRICLCRGPSGEPVELIEIGKGRNNEK